MEIKLTWEEFEEQFKPIQNIVTKREEFNGWLYETYGDDLEYVQQMVKTLPLYVWTIVDVGDYSVICDGYHHVNRQGYIITDVPAIHEHTYEVADPEEVEIAEYRERLDALAVEMYGEYHDIEIDTPDIDEAIGKGWTPGELLDRHVNNLKS